MAILVVAVVVTVAVGLQAAWRQGGLQRAWSAASNSGAWLASRRDRGNASSTEGTKGGGGASSDLPPAACAGRIVVFVRVRRSDFPERAHAIASTWATQFPHDDVILMSGESIPGDTSGMRVEVDARIGADPLYRDHPVHDPLILPLAAQELAKRPEARYVLILNSDTLVLPENLCSRALPFASTFRDPTQEYIWAGFGFVMGAPWGANTRGDECLREGRAPRPPPASPGGEFASAASGYLLSRKLVMDIGPRGEDIWRQTWCIDSGDMRLWWGFYFHENDALGGKSVRSVVIMNEHFVMFSPWGKYAEYPTDYAITDSDRSTYHATFAGTGVDEQLVTWQVVTEHKTSGLHAGDLILGYRKF